MAHRSTYPEQDKVLLQQETTPPINDANTFERATTPTPRFYTTATSSTLAIAPSPSRNKRYRVTINCTTNKVSHAIVDINCCVEFDVEQVVESPEMILKREHCNLQQHDEQFANFLQEPMSFDNFGPTQATTNDIDELYSLWEEASKQNKTMF
jgi:hypothetical protein